LGSTGVVRWPAHQERLDDVWNLPLEQFVTPASVEPLKASLQDALKGKELDTCVVDIQPADGSISCCIQIKPSVQQDHQGNIVRILCFASRDSNGSSERRNSTIAYNHVTAETSQQLCCCTCS